MSAEDGVAVFSFACSVVLHASEIRALGYRSYLQSGGVDLDFFALERDDCCDFLTVVDSGGQFGLPIRIYI